jgi:hypothetical protein
MTLNAKLINGLAKNFGAIAQLGERLHGMQQVSGSIPLSSTKKMKGLQQCSPFLLTSKKLFDRRELSADLFCNPNHVTGDKCPRR